MKTECSTKNIEFQKNNTREVVGRFDGGAISSDAGGLLLREVEQAVGAIRQIQLDYFVYQNKYMWFSGFRLTTWRNDGYCLLLVPADIDRQAVPARAGVLLSAVKKF
ncbi:MAG TPA: hypothetical protein PLN69_08515 [bacterium]|nr:hypothetical protein [bacterium]